MPLCTEAAEEETSCVTETGERGESSPKPSNRLWAVVPEERILESNAEGTETSDLSDHDREWPVLGRSKRTIEPCHRYSAPEWSYYMDSGCVVKVPRNELLQEEEDKRPP